MMKRGKHRTMMTPRVNSGGRDDDDDGSNCGETEIAQKLPKLRDQERDPTLIRSSQVS